MTNNIMTLIDYIRKEGLKKDLDFVREAAEYFGQELIEMEAEEDILVYKTFPEEHHRSIHSINPLEHLNREIRQRTRVVGVFPDRSSVYRLVGVQLMNIDEDWRAGRRYMAKKGIRKLFDNELEEDSKSDYILENQLINLEVENVIYTT